MGIVFKKPLETVAQAAEMMKKLENDMEKILLAGGAKKTAQIQDSSCYEVPAEKAGDLMGAMMALGSAPLSEKPFVKGDWVRVVVSPAPWQDRTDEVGEVIAVFPPTRECREQAINDGINPELMGLLQLRMGSGSTAMFRVKEVVHV